MDNIRFSASRSVNSVIYSQMNGSWESYVDGYDKGSFTTVRVLLKPYAC